MKLHDSGDDATVATASVTMEESFATAADANVEEVLPIALSVVGRLQGQKVTKSYVVLLDSGSKTSWINAKSLPKGIRKHTSSTLTVVTI